MLPSPTPPVVRGHRIVRGRHIVPVAFALAAMLILAPSTPADVLITTEGQRIDTQGPWQRAGEHLIYIDQDGERQRIHLAQIDLEASREMTAEANGETYTPPPAAPPTTAVPRTTNSSSEAQIQFADIEGRSPIILYETSWCGYCRKARKLLKQLDADFEAKDVESDRVAAQEARAKAGGGGGVPLLDFAGVMVRGYNDRQIRTLVRSMRDQGLLDTPTR